MSARCEHGQQCGHGYYDCCPYDCHNEYPIASQDSRYNESASEQLYNDGWSTMKPKDD